MVAAAVVVHAPPTRPAPPYHPPHHEEEEEQEQDEHQPGVDEATALSSPCTGHQGKLKGAVCCGYLNKYGKNVKRWKRRYFVLKASTFLYHFLSEEDEEPRGCIDLDVFSTVRQLRIEPDGKVIFKISAPDGGDDNGVTGGHGGFLLEAKDETEASWWMEALVTARSSTITMERNLLKAQNQQFIAEIEALETQLHQLQVYAEGRHDVEEILHQERQEKKKMVESLDQLHSQLLMSGSMIGKSETEVATSGSSRRSWDLALEEVMGWARALEGEVKEARSRCQGLEAELKKARDCARQREEELRAAKREQEVMQAKYQQTLLYLQAKHHKLEKKYVRAVGSHHDLQQMACHLQSQISKLRRQRQVLVQEVMKLRQQPGPPASALQDVCPQAPMGEDPMGGGEVDLEPKTVGPVRGGEEVKDDGLLAAAMEERTQSTDKHHARKKQRQDGGGPVPALLPVGLVNKLAPKIEQLGLIASDGLSRTISLRHLLNLEPASASVAGSAHAPNPPSPSPTVQVELSSPSTPSTSKLVEYEVEFTAPNRVGLKLQQARDADGQLIVVVSSYQGPELELLNHHRDLGKAEGAGRWEAPKLEGATLVGVQGVTVEQVDLIKVKELIRLAGRPLKLRFREVLCHHHSSGILQSLLLP